MMWSWRLAPMASADSSRLSRGCRVCDWSLKRMIVSVGLPTRMEMVKRMILLDGLVNDADKVLTDPTSLIDGHAAGLLAIHLP